MAGTFCLRAADVDGYAPANHYGTINRRLVGASGLRSDAVEVVRGSIRPGHGASPHLHPGMEQVVYILAGRAKATLGGRSEYLEPGDCCLFPANVAHAFEAVGTETAEILVIYTPPYGEDPCKVRTV